MGEILKDKKVWRCNVCNDIHIGKNLIKICPTCNQKDVYVEIEFSELKNLLKK